MEEENTAVRVTDAYMCMSYGIVNLLYVCGMCHRPVRRLLKKGVRI